MYSRLSEMVEYTEEMVDDALLLEPKPRCDGCCSGLNQVVPPFSAKYYPRRSLETGAFEPYIAEH